MFVRYYVELPLAVEDVREALLSSPQDWVPGLAEDAEERTESLLAEVGFGLTGRRVEKLVQLEVGQPFLLASKTVLPLTWRATTAEALFPSLEADLEVASLSWNRTQLSISARYSPPLGAVGRAIDKALLHRVAEATIKDFLDRTGEVILARTLSSSPAGS